MSTPCLRATFVAVAVSAGLLVAGCGDDGDDEISTDGDATTTTTTTEGPVSEAVSVAEALELQDGTEVTVQAHVFQPNEGATILCDVFGESYPPSCVGPQLVTNGLDVDSLPGLETSAANDQVAPARWTSAPVEVTGTLADGALQVA